jgi:hypothetical protein
VVANQVVGLQAKVAKRGIPIHPKAKPYHYGLVVAARGTLVVD